MNGKIISQLSIIDICFNDYSITVCVYKIINRQMRTIYDHETRSIIGCQSQGATAPIYSPSHVRDDTVCLQILIIRRAIPAINFAVS